jgi:peptide/nickel transport system permease protein
VSEVGERGSLLSRIIGDRRARASLIVIVLLVLAAIVGPLVEPHGARDQLDIVNLKNAHPSWRFPLGTDQYSRDLLSRVLDGARISLSVASLSIILSMTLGTAYGLVAGYAGGRLDGAMMRVLDALLAIPRVLLLIATLTLWHPIRLPGLIILIGVTGWFGVSRLVRGETIAARKLAYVESARALGASSVRIVVGHVLPNIAGTVIVTATLGIGNVIALEAGLSYLGIGAPEPHASWGSIFFDGVTSYSGNWWMIVFPGIAIVVTVLAFNTLGDALRDILDPRQLHQRYNANASIDSIPTGMIPRQNG